MTTTDTQLALQSATELTAALRRGQIGSRELLSYYLERIDRLNPAINAVVTLDETALESEMDVLVGLERPEVARVDPANRRRQLLLEPGE